MSDIWHAWADRGAMFDESIIKRPQFKTDVAPIEDAALQAWEEMAEAHVDVTDITTLLMKHVPTGNFYEVTLKFNMPTVGFVKPVKIEDYMDPAK